MIDVHCHLLPGIDDGPVDLAESLNLCRLMVNNGISHAVATPHIHAGRWENDQNSIAHAHKILQQALEIHAIPLQLAMAAEVRIGAEILPMLAARIIPMLGQWQRNNITQQVLLLELPHNQLPPGTEKLVAWLLARNILPMIAHPERNKDFQRQPKKLQPFIEMGCLLQVTASSVVGGFGEAAQQLAANLLERNAVTVIATDAHNDKGRRPMLLEAQYWIKKNYSKEYAEQLVLHNPWLLVQHHFSARCDG